MRLFCGKKLERRIAFDFDFWLARTEEQKAQGHS